MTAPQQPPADAAVVAAYQQQTQALRDKLVAALLAYWAALGTYRIADAGRFLAQALPMVLAGQRQMSSLTVGYYSARRTAVLGRSRTVRVDPAAVTGAAARKGADPAEVYTRPFHLVARQLAELPHVDGAIEQAITAGRDRLVQTALTDLQLTKTRTSQQVVSSDPRVVGYRRVLEGEASCGLCIVASTLRYHKGELLPIHPACDCSVAEIYGDRDPGPTINVGRLNDVHDRIQARFGQSSSAARVIPGTATPEQAALLYRDVLITHEHGELGPVLGVHGQPFLGPEDLS